MRVIPNGFTLFQEDLEHVARHLDDDWDRLRGAHLFITGGTGFFGMWLLESLLWANETRGLGMRVTALSRSPERFLAERAPHLKGRPGLEFVAGSLTDFAFPAQPCTHILHAASETNLEQSADWAQRHLNAALGGTQRLIEMASRHRSEALLITTSGAVYSPMDSVVNDRCVEGPAGLADYASEKIVYGQSKRMMEIMTSVAAQQVGFRALIARCFAFVGPYLPLEANYAIGNFLRDALAGRDVVVGGDGTPLRSYLYAADLAVWLLRILARGRTGVPYNVGGEHAMSIGDLARTVARVAGGTSSVQIKGTPVPGAKPSAYLPSVARARDELGLDIFVPIDDAIARTLAWHRSRGVGS
ncbi:epimerase [Trinickia dabaoshanensis]|uniref:Epimerase n=2 Tax=Trinickia dabaoshanensis TaxID=564714 RepID=A0A2N7VFE1_9BURK|nr:epimerase [Trinickia dabaoshanensis]